MVTLLQVRGWVIPLRIITSLLLAGALLPGYGLAGCGAASPAERSDRAGTGAPAAERLALTTRPAVEAGADVLGPAGWQGLNLSMSEPRAITTGALGGRTGAPTPCQQWSTKRSGTVSSVFISQRLGVAAIVAAVGAGTGAAMHTPEGMTFGWTLDQVNKTYPGVSPEVDGTNARFVPIPGNSRARYRVGFDAGGHVSALTLELTAQDCYD